MKKSRFTKLVAVILSLLLLGSSLGLTANASHAYELIGSDNAITVILSDILDTILRFLLGTIAGVFDDGPKITTEFDPATLEADLRNSPTFYNGIGNNFKTAAETDARWNIGYANASLIPDHVDDGNFYIGGYITAENLFTNVVEGVIDDMKVRCVAISDNNDHKNTVLFATVDCIGITNNDIKDIRALLTDFAAANDIKSINVEATHCHSCIDTEGLWTRNMAKILDNSITSISGSDAELQEGTNQEFMKFMKQKVADTLMEAYFDMTPGTLSYSEMDIGQNYFENKNRPSSGVEERYLDANNEEQVRRVIGMDTINRFTFDPDDGSKDLMMINMAAHPDVAGLPTSSNSGREISGDYVYYLGEYLDKAGYDFMFFQGAIAGIYEKRSVTSDGVETAKRWEETRRYGYEIARIALAMNKSIDEIKADPLLNVEDEIAEYGNNGYYSIWYANWDQPIGTETVTDADGKETTKDIYPEPGTDWAPVVDIEVEPFLNLTQDIVRVVVSNDLIKAAGKLNLANYTVYHDEATETYFVYTEVGYIEFGNQFKAVLMPGEICQDLIIGGTSLQKKYAVTSLDYWGQTAAQIFGDDVKCFGLCNDAIGYVVPDNDYTMGNPVDHYHELIGLGQNVGTALTGQLADLNASIVRV